MTKEVFDPIHSGLTEALSVSKGWSTDITAAPRGEEKITTTIVDGKERTKREYHVAPVWLAFADGKVKRSYWVPEAKGFPARWSGCTAAETPISWQHYVVPEHPFANTPRKAAEAVVERPASTGATVASGLVEADKAEAVAGGLGQPELIPALTAQHGGVNVGGPERAGVTGGESAATISPEEAEEMARYTTRPGPIYLEDCGSGA